MLLTETIKRVKTVSVLKTFFKYKVFTTRKPFQNRVLENNSHTIRTSDVQKYSYQLYKNLINKFIYIIYITPTKMKINKTSAKHYLDP